MLWKAEDRAADGVPRWRCSPFVVGGAGAGHRRQGQFSGLSAAMTAAGPGPPELRLQLAESERLLYRAQLCSKTNGGETTRYRGVWDCIAR